MLSRAAGLLVALFTLNLSAAETLRACANLEQHERATPAAAEHHGHHGAPEQVPAEEEDCEKPAQARCCSALSSCGPNVAIDGDLEIVHLIPDRDPASAVAARAPSALERTPEPPPPKA